MDRLDKASLIAIVVLAVIVLVLVVGESRQQGPEQRVVQEGSGAKMGASPDFEKRILIASELISAENFGKAEELIRGLVAEFSYEGEPYLLLGDLEMRRQDSIRAVMEYRRAVELNPDYLDKKAPAFQGKKIRNAVEEAAILLEKGIDDHSSADRLKEYQETLKYMRRRIAGSCG